MRAAKSEKKALGERVRQAREQLDLKQWQVGERAGIPTQQAGQTISNLERGSTEPMAITLAKIARALGVSADWLALGEEAAPKTLHIWLQSEDGAPARNDPEARRFLASLPVGQLEPEPQFWASAYHAYRYGLKSAADAARHAEIASREKQD